MKVGQTVNFYDPKSGDRQDAEITAITGAGASLSKILTLRVGNKEVKKVVHAADAKGGDPFWMVKGGDAAPRGWAKAKKGEPLIPEDGEPSTIEAVAEATEPTRS